MWQTSLRHRPGPKSASGPRRQTTHQNVWRRRWRIFSVVPRLSPRPAHRRSFKRRWCALSLWAVLHDNIGASQFIGLAKSVEGDLAVYPGLDIAVKQ